MKNCHLTLNFFALSSMLIANVPLAAAAPISEATVTIRLNNKRVVAGYQNVENKIKREQGLTDEETSGINDTFKQIDLNGDGQIDDIEFSTTFGDGTTDAELQDMIKGADADKNGTIDLAEFVVMLTITDNADDMTSPTL